MKLPKSENAVRCIAVCVRVRVHTCIISKRLLQKFEIKKENLIKKTHTRTHSLVRKISYEKKNRNYDKNVGNPNICGIKK